MAPLRSGAKSGRKSTFVDTHQRTQHGNVPRLPIEFANLRASLGRRVRLALIAQAVHI
jgi:hypothetical protein